MRHGLYLLLAITLALGSLACGGDNGGDEGRTASPTRQAARATPSSDSEEGLTVAEWAEQFCAIQQELADATVETRGLPAVGPTMSFEDRKARALIIWPNLQAAYAEVLVAYAQITPPTEAAQFHGQQVREATAIEKFYRETLPQIEGAQTHADIDAVNLQQDAVATPLAESAGRVRMTAAVRSALDFFIDQSRCGVLGPQ